jgi:hypothetical protein
VGRKRQGKVTDGLSSISTAEIHQETPFNIDFEFKNERTVK